MDPTPEEVAAWYTIVDVVAWAQLPGDLGNAQSVAGLFLQGFGASATDHWRALAMIPESVCSETAASWPGHEAGEWMPSVFQRGQAAL
eukprot:4368649-Amphidinium_carterae.1